jgi:hypothetical protein
MGLDTVDLVMAFEDEFDIAIPDAWASRMSTVDDTVRCIIELLEATGATTNVCATARSFYALRKALMINFGVARDDVILGMPIGALVSERGRRGWSPIAMAAGLRREPWTFKKRGSPPPEMTVRTLIETRCKSVFRHFDGSIDREAVFQQVRQIISFQVGVPVWNIHRDTRYFKDLS